VNRSSKSVEEVTDEAMLRALWDEHGSALLRCALRLTGGDRAWAEDVVQETLLRAWQHPSSVEATRGPVRPWLVTVARRVVIDQHRARGARPLEVAADQVPEALTEDGIDGALESWLVAEALTALTPLHREALLHTYYAGRTVSEAAQLLGVPVGTVKSRVFYALRALKLALEERGVTSP
jgi:RNA polymerase sigma-70 factor (ECF subfamily)